MGKETTFLKQRHPKYQILFFFVALLFGLSVRNSEPHLPYYFSLMGPDMIWAGMVFLGFGILFPNTKTLSIGVYSIVFAFGVEISQLYQADWINEIRSNKWGGLVLGHGFLWSDLLAYTLGIGILGFLDQKFIYRKQTKRNF